MIEEATSALVAVIEDDAPSLVAMGRLLRAGGFETSLFPSAEAFISAPPARTPLCLILDVNLDGMSGIDLQQHLRETGSALPIIVTTGRHDNAIRDRAEATGCTAFLWKPFAPTTLLALIDTIVRQSHP
jgi:FixJ family two-component response regulator